MNLMTMAGNILPFVGVSKRDENGRITEIFTPASTVIGSDGKRGASRSCRVTLTRNGDALLMTCTTSESIPCPASSKNDAICYHCAAALLAVAMEQKSKLLLFSNRKDADKCKSDAGRGRVLTVTIGKATTYAVVLPEVKAAPREPVRSSQAERKQSPGKCACGVTLADPVQEERGLCPSCDQSTDRKQPATVKPLDLFPDEQEGAYGTAHHIKRKKRAKA